MTSRPFDVEAVRRDFPILSREIGGKPLVYLDSAATSQKPQVVIDALTAYYTGINANVHRGVHTLSQEATDAYEGARTRVREFINAAEDAEIVFTRGTTEGINLVAHSLGAKRVVEGSEVIISNMEHHSNVVPWQILCEERGARLRVVPINEDGELLMDEFEAMLGPQTALVSIVHMSNALGTINPAKDIVSMAHARGVPVLLDGAQAAPHLPVDVRDLDCDFYALSGHKLFGREWLEAMPPYQGGGDMIKSVTFERTIYNDLPYKFEAGTPHIAGVVGLGAAIDYVNGIGLERAAAYEHELLEYGTEQLQAIEGLTLIGTARQKASVLSFVLDGIHPHDIGTVLDTQGIAIRTGHHCTQPLMQRFQVPATARASLAFYNTRAEIDALVEGIHKTFEVFS